MKQWTYSIVLFAMCVLAGCDKTTVDFSYSPEAPRAGQSVRFSNSSTDGEEWAWSFGDGSTSESKSPSHTYKQPGTYTVTLQVDKKKSLTRVKSITVYDTVPTFVCSDSVLTVFRDVTFKAHVYNPYNYTITYQWDVVSNTQYVAVSESNSASSYTVYFAQAAPNAGVRLTMMINGEETVVEKVFAVQDTTATQVLMRTAGGDYGQRIFAGNRFEMPLPVSDAAAKTLLDGVQDTMQVFNNETFMVSTLRAKIPDIEGFRIANRKLYYRRANGLYVSHIDGSQAVQIEAQPTRALTIDVADNRLYWAVADSVRYMPLVGSDNNRFTTVPTTLNTLQSVEKITIRNK